MVTKKKASPAQIAARKLFAERAKAGDFAAKAVKAKKRKAVNKSCDNVDDYWNSIDTRIDRKTNPIKKPVVKKDYVEGGYRERVGLYRVLAEKKNGGFEEVAKFADKKFAFEYARAFSKSHFRVTSVHDSK